MKRSAGCCAGLPRVRRKHRLVHHETSTAGAPGRCAEPTQCFRFAVFSPVLILGIETSCDETAAAVVENGVRVLSSIVASQIDVHHPYGGVVPELAARRHIEAVVPVVNQALSAAGIQAEELNGVAVTQGPGLVGALLVGFSFAKAYAYGLGIPWVGVNHLAGHIHSLFLTADPPPFPFVALLASGGHTALYHVTAPRAMTLMGQTLDDAAGEAFDKVSKMLGCGYPGGRVIERLAARGDPRKIEFPRSYLDKKAYDFSFSGIKTAVNRYIQKHAEAVENERSDIAAGFQAAVVDVLAYKLLKATADRGCRHAALVGGVAANACLGETVRRAAGSEITVHIPPPAFCGDNAAMIAGAGYHDLVKGRCSRLEDDVYSRAAR